MADTIASLVAAHRADSNAIIDTIRGCFARWRAYGDAALFIYSPSEQDVLAQAAPLAQSDGRDQPLYGIPIAVKDNIDVAGWPTTAGCPAFAYVAQKDATVVARLKQAGAIILGKTNLTGKAKRVLSEAILQAHTENTLPTFSPFPQPIPPDCGARVDDFGRRYYSALGIDRTDMAARARQTGRNFVFFEAPVGLIFTIHAALTKHSWLDQGLFLQNFMLAAHVRGLATCPQVSFVRFQPIIAKQLALGFDELVTCGMSLGSADKEAAVNRLSTPREPVHGFTRWLGFDD